MDVDKGKRAVNGKFDTRAMRSEGQAAPLIRLGKLADTLPSQWMEFTPSPNRQYIEHVRELLRDHLGVIQPGDRTFDSFSAVPRYFHPYADLDALTLSLELVSWYFYFDDPFDDGDADVDGREQIARMVSVLEDLELPPDATGCERLGLRFIQHARVMSGSRESSWQRFRDLCIEWVESILPINHRFRLAVPTLGQYAELRLVNVGILPIFALNEIMLGLDLDARFLRLPAVVRFERLAALVIAYFNDVYSYEREVRQRTQFNSVALRQQHESLTLELAFERQVDVVHGMVAEMLSLEQKLRTDQQIGLSVETGTAPIAVKRRAQTRYIEGIKNIVVGNYLWSHSDGRYYSPTSPFVELRERTPDRRRRASIAQAGNV